MTQLRVLTRLFDCEWLTYWERKDIFQLVRSLYGAGINEKMTYAVWDHDHAQRKAEYVLRPGKPTNFWWLEDPLCSEEIEALRPNHNLKRYIRVEPIGHWGFLDGVNELFKRSGVTQEDIKRVGGNPEWFDKEHLATQISLKESLIDSLTMIKLLANAETADAETRLKEIQNYIQMQLDTVY